MTTFLIQSANGSVLHDFSFTLVEAVKFNNWYYDEQMYDYLLTEAVPHDTPDKDIVPIGSVEFVREYARKNFGIENIRPINIPSRLMKREYLKRWVRIDTYDEPQVNTNGKIFIKSNDIIKGKTDVLRVGETIPQGEWLISEYVDIDSEWRCFIFNNRLVGLKNYAGSFTIFPDVELINKMTGELDTGAYTLDVGINSKGTFVLEVHDFASVGLYGFSDYTLLPKMFVSGWKKILTS